MERTSSWLISFFIIIFWVFRLIVAITTQNGSELGGFIAFDLNTEIVILFITVFSLFFIMKRKIFGGLVYIIIYCYYFGGYIINNALPQIINGNAVDMTILQNMLVSLLAIFISVFALIDLIIDKKIKNKYTDKKTDWFFNEKSTDREVDERADKNQYKLY